MIYGYSIYLYDILILDISIWYIYMIHLYEAIGFAIKNDADSWTQIDFLRIFLKINIFIIFLCRGALGTRPEALGTLGIDSTSI